MGNIQANTKVFGCAKVDDLVGIDKQVVMALAAKQPREGRHGLGDDFDAVGVNL